MSSDGSDYDTRLTAEETEAIAEMLRMGVPERGASIHGPEVRGNADPIVLRYDLVAGTSRRTDDLPGLQLIHERFAHDLVSEFRRAVGQEGYFAAEPVLYTRFAEIYANLNVPTALIIANLVGVGCSIIVEMEPHLMLHFLDLLMGGQGGMVAIRGGLAVRGFTPTEQGVIHHLTAIFSRALSNAWSDVAPISLQVVRVATDPRHAALYSPGEAMVDASVKCEWNDVSGILRLILPLSHLSQFGDQLSRTATPDHLKAETQEMELMRQSLYPVPVHVRALLGSCEMKVSELLGLEVGQVLRLDSDPSEPVVIYIEDEPKLRGFPTVQRGNVAIDLTAMIGLDEYEQPEETEDD
ncbi:MAG: FliM/FliN family flagellar motor switch protein [Deltaproteobacteria bacterium]|nr:FliM/FliN family flagellar motor switch protein [Deltaproteobacteria bacterium]